MPVKLKFYVVWKGRKTGIFSTWEECAVQVQGFTGARYKGFTQRAAAEQAFRGTYHEHKNQAGREWLFAPATPLADGYAVDAACSGNPGRLEYRGVCVATGREIFHKGPYEQGTNNIGEFLALVHMLEYLKQKGIPAPVYSDSQIAIGWVKQKTCRTQLRQDARNLRLFELIRRAEAWLTKNEAANRILKWDTQAWGEIPADFNRK